MLTGKTGQGGGSVMNRSWAIDERRDGQMSLVEKEITS
jgi:hypothetical protein